ncbi:MAG: hypothetical protein ACYTET_05820 [Planctomycetota bacterium]|jgi:hypothetical protein
MKLQKVLFLSVLVCFVGCVPSLHQLWTEDTLVYDPHFVGTFNDPDDKMWTIEGDPEDKLYRITIDEDDDAPDSELIARLVDVKGHLFFDFYPDGEIVAGDWTKFHIIGAHLFYKVEKTETGFKLAMMNPDTVNDLLEKDPSLVKHEMVSGSEGDDERRAVLTDTPENLQKFLLEGLTIEKFFADSDDDTELKRIRPETKTAM